MPELKKIKNPLRKLPASFKLRIGALIFLSLLSSGGFLLVKQKISLRPKGEVLVPQAKPDLPDLDVAFIERLPKIDYDNPKKWPDQGETVEFRAQVKNHGSQNSGVFNYQWKIDEEVFAGSWSNLAPEEEVVFSHRWIWPHAKTSDNRITGSHTVEFIADPDNYVREISETNNKVKDFTQALAVGFWVEKSVYDFFNERQYDYCQDKSCQGSNSWEDWAQRQIREWNRLFEISRYPQAPEGVIDRVRLDKINVVKDCDLPLNPLNNFRPERANDGDTTILDLDWKVYRVDVKPGDWWQVDLGHDYTFKQIKIWSRAINPHDWWDKFRIETSLTEAFSGEQTVVAREDDWPDVRSKTYSFTPQTSRFVRVVSEVTQKYTGLQEFEVFDLTGVNLALNKQANAISWQIESAGNLPDTRDKTVDLMWGFDTAIAGKIVCGFRDEMNPSKNLYLINPNFQNLEYSLMHELSHARYLFDTYYYMVDGSRVLLTDNFGQRIAGTPLLPYVLGTWVHLDKDGKMMGGGNYNEGYGLYSVKALNLIQGQRARCGNYSPPCNIGEFIADLPNRNIWRILDKNSQPIPNAEIKIYRINEDQPVGQRKIFSLEKGSLGQFDQEVYSLLEKAKYNLFSNFDPTPDISGRTDSNGFYNLGHNPFSADPDKPLYWQGILLAEVSSHGQKFYFFQEITDFNFAYWEGKTNEAVYPIVTSIDLSPPPTPTPTPRLLHYVDHPMQDHSYSSPFDFSGWTIWRDGQKVEKVEFYMDLPKGQVGKYGEALTDQFERPDLCRLNPLYCRAGWKWRFNPSWVNNGPHKVYVYTYDNERGYVGEPVVRNFIAAVPTLTPTPTTRPPPPTLTPTPTPNYPRLLHNVDSPPQNSFITSSFDVSGWTAWEGGGRVEKVEFYLDFPNYVDGNMEIGYALCNEYRPDLDTPVMRAYKNSGWHWRFNVSTSYNGWHKLYIYAYDSTRGYVGSPVIRDFLVAIPTTIPTPTKTPTPRPTQTPTPTPTSGPCPLRIQQGIDSSASPLPLNDQWQNAPFAFQYSGYVDRIAVRVGAYGGGRFSCKLTNSDGSDLSSEVYSQEISNNAPASWRDLRFTPPYPRLNAGSYYNVSCHGPVSYARHYWQFDTVRGQTYGKTYRIYVCQ